MVAWLVTWEWVGNNKKVKNNIAAVLNYRIPPQKVRKIVELLYVNSKFSLSERLAYAKNKRNNPYPAEFDDIDGIPWEGRIVCGHNPYLEARLVDNLHIYVDENGEETLKWKERSKPKNPLR